MDQPGQDDAGQEGFAGAGGAKDARRALDEFVQVQADRMALLAGVADDEVAAFLALAEDLGDIAGPARRTGAWCGGTVLTGSGAGSGRKPSSISCRQCW